MTYKTVADMADSYTLRRRLYAGAGQETIPDPTLWVNQYNWTIVSQPGWDAAWESAVASGVPDPGDDESVITDAMILSGIQAVNVPEA